MNNLLPKEKEILPIKEEWSTFYESGFNEEFDKISFKKKLQIVTDIIRQTILYDEFPNPELEEEKLIGDSYTASQILIKYLKELSLGDNYNCVLSIDYYLDPNQLYSTHFITLVENNNIIYQLDPTPTTGYKCGQVEEIDNNKFYNTYIELSEESNYYLNIIRTIMYNINNKTINDKLIKKYLNIIEEIPKDDILNGFIYKCLYSLYKKSKSNYLKEYIFNKYLNKLNDDYYIKDDLLYKNKDSYKQIKYLKEELKTLINEDNNYKRQLEISQLIVSELIKYNKQYDKKLIINNKKISFTNINPRLFLENGLNVVLLKPSSYKSKTDSIIKNKYLENEETIQGEYFPNLGKPSEILGLKPMRLFHPCGYKYERSMYGPGDLFLVKQKADDIKNIKKELRKILANDYKNKSTTWYDKEEIYWDPEILNLVHTTDDPSEASLHYLAAYPEYQVMTRFMYPNPKLKVLEKER